MEPKTGEWLSEVSLPRIAGSRFSADPHGIQMDPAAVTARNNSEAARPRAMDEDGNRRGRWKMGEGAIHSETCFV